MDKRSQMRELIAFDSTGRWTVAFMSGTLTFLLFIAVEKGYASSTIVVVLGMLTSLPALNKTWAREKIKKRYLHSYAAKRLVHLSSIVGFVTYPFIIWLLIAVVSNQITMITFFTMIGIGALCSWVAHKLYERHMIRLDDNYVSETELNEERKWGSA